jgi:hypothetical protein
MIRAYFDDSGTHHRYSAVTAMGGLLGSITQWEEFETRWAAKLAHPLPGKPRLKAFHLSHNGDTCHDRRRESAAV